MRLLIILIILFSTTSINTPNIEKHSVIYNEGVIDTNHVRNLLLELENNKIKLYNLENQIHDKHTNTFSRTP